MDGFDEFLIIRSNVLACRRVNDGSVGQSESFSPVAVLSQPNGIRGYCTATYGTHEEGDGDD